MMTSADLDHNDKLLAAGKKEKLEWVTPKMMLMESDMTHGSGNKTVPNVEDSSGSESEWSSIS
jgi:hypothetical protein